MDKSNLKDTKFPDKCIEFTRNLFHIYLEERNFLLLISMLDDNISCFGTGMHEICKNKSDMIKLIENEAISWHGRFEILEQWYEAIPMNHEFCTVIGALKLVKSDSSQPLTKFNASFSMVCHIIGDYTKLFHSHFSITSDTKDNTNQLEFLANNIEGGIELCKYEDEFPILYVNDGFLDLTGYSREEIFALKNHTNMIPTDEVPSLIEKIKEQLKYDNKFSVEYRLLRKDGTFIWVLDRGTLIEDKDSSIKLQSTMIDITEQKETEIMLKVSEKRYKIALTFADISMFEYNIITKELILVEKDSEMYDVPTIIKDGPNTFVKTGIIEPDYAENYLEMYHKIHNGEPTASCYIKSKDVGNMIHDFELNLTNIYDNTGRPVRAIGVRKNITQLRQLQRENQYGKTLTSNQTFIYEVNITNDKVITMDKKWSNQLNVANITQYTQMKDIICKRFIHSNHAQLFLDTLSKENINNAYDKGERLIHLDYQQKMNPIDYRWFRKNINIIKDEFLGDITIRCYIIDINDTKIEELKQQENQRLYETVLSKSSTIYEYNLSQDIFLTGHEEWWQHLDIDATNSYSIIMSAFQKKLVHPEDHDNYSKCFLKHNILDTESQLNTPVVCEYRYRDPADENFVWLRCTFYLYKDSFTGDMKGYSYTEDIHAEKTRELELIYNSEHDGLTTLYNKAASEKYMTDFFLNGINADKEHALFIIDIDYFKSVNDTFGHADGDIVLTQVAHKIKDSFRKNDIIGRIGGDEFIVLMKNISDKNTAFIKAQELCDKIDDAYLKKNTKLKITVSIGIAFYGEHGNCYHELFKHSDIALYVSKEKGRNRYTVYDNNIKNKESDEPSYYQKKSPLL